MRQREMGARLRAVAVGWLLGAMLLVSPVFAAPPEPQIKATAAAVVDLATGSILWGKDMHVVRAPASLTKMLTALVATDLAPLDVKITAQNSDLVGESTMDLKAGETLPLEVYLYGLLLPSGNDAAQAIARTLGAQPGDTKPEQGTARFVDKMNAKARALGARETRFASPDGLDAANQGTSAYDLAIIGAAFAGSPALMKVAGTVTYEGYGHTLHNTNKLLYDGRYPSVMAGKTGQTDDAGWCLMTVANKNGRKILSVHLGTTTEAFWTDAIKLLDYGFATPPPPKSGAAGGTGGAYAGAVSGADAETRIAGADDPLGDVDPNLAIPLPPGVSVAAGDTARVFNSLDDMAQVATQLPLTAFVLPPPPTNDNAMGVRYTLLTLLTVATGSVLYVRRGSIQLAFAELRGEWQAALADPPHLVATGPIPLIPTNDHAHERRAITRFEEMGHAVPNEEGSAARSCAVQAIRQSRGGNRAAAYEAFAQVVALEPSFDWGGASGFWELPVSAYADLAVVLLDADHEAEARTLLMVATLAYPNHRELRAVEAMLPRQLPGREAARLR